MIYFKCILGQFLLILTPTLELSHCFGLPGWPNPVGGLFQNIFNSIEGLLNYTMPLIAAELVVHHRVILFLEIEKWVISCIPVTLNRVPKFIRKLIIFVKLVNFQFFNSTRFNCWRRMRKLIYPVWLRYGLSVFLKNLLTGLPGRLLFRVHIFICCTLVSWCFILVEQPVILLGPSPNCQTFCHK